MHHTLGFLPVVPDVEDEQHIFTVHRFSWAIRQHIPCHQRSRPGSMPGQDVWCTLRHYTIANQGEVNLLLEGGASLRQPPSAVTTTLAWRLSGGL